MSDKETLFEEFDNALGEMGIIFTDEKLKIAFEIFATLVEKSISEAKLDIIKTMREGLS